jgi:Spy/CpxP family protein refolding chaperone
MKTLIKRSSVVLILAVVINMPFVASASPNCHNFKYGNHRHMLRILNLSEGQRDQIFRIRHNSQPARYENIKRIRAINKALRRMALSQYYDRYKVHQLVSEQARSVAALKEIRTRNLHRTFSVLTGAQQQCLLAKLHHRHAL